MGTPRSGTTLVQRLVSEWTGALIPPETHFWPEFAHPLWSRHEFPVSRAGVEAELRQWPRLTEILGELDLDLADVMAELDDPCERMWDLFAAIVRTLAGPGDLYGEKSPRNLIWWHVLARDVPELKFIAVVRDPRAVVASATTVPFGSDSHVVRAEEWRADQRLLHDAVQALPTRRLLVVRYEELVTDLAAADRRVCDFLGASHPASSPVAGQARPAFLRREVWKANAYGEITADRVEVWRSTLTPHQAEQVAAICRAEMGVFGYEHAAPSRMVSLRHLAKLGPRDQLRRLRFRRNRRRRVGHTRGVRA